MSVVDVSNPECGFVFCAGLQSGLSCFDGRVFELLGGCAVLATLLQPLVVVSILMVNETDTRMIFNTQIKVEYRQTERNGIVMYSWKHVSTQIIFTQLSKF